PATQRLHGELQAGARPGEGIGQLVGDDAGQRADVLKRVGPHWPRLVRPHFPAVEEPEAQPGELEREALAATPLAALRGWRGRPPVTSLIPLAIGARNTYASNFTSRQAMRRSRNERGVTIDVKR